MKIYTRRGDQGETDLIGAGRVPKDHPRIAATGELDALNAQLGAARAETAHEDLRALVENIQCVLFELGAALACPDAAHREKAGLGIVGDAEVEALEQRIDACDEELEPLRSFVLPGGSPAAAAFHVARATCRGAERLLVGLDSSDPAVASALRYLNRLSDLLFALARLENQRAGLGDIPWQGRRR